MHVTSNKCWQVVYYATRLTNTVNFALYFKLLHPLFYYFSSFSELKLLHV